VIAHQRKGTDVDGKDFGERGEALEDQLFAVVEGPAGHRVATAKKCSANATAYAVVVRSVTHGHQ
jgi:hypothetical protein